jgi:hypothetical protein
VSDLAYPTLVFVHLLLFVLWLGADVGVFLLGQHFRKRAAYTLEQRLALLKLLVEVDMVPRSAWALMSRCRCRSWRPADTGRSPWLLAAAWILGAAWLWLVWDAHRHDGTARAKRDRGIEFWLRSSWPSASWGSEPCRWPGARLFRRAGWPGRRCCSAPSSWRRS